MRKIRFHCQGSLMKNSIRILMGIFGVMCLAFTCNYMIINQWYQKESIESRERFFLQVVNQAEKFMTEVEDLSYSAASTGTVIGYLQEDDLGGRWGKYGELSSFIANLMKLDEDIVSVSVYDQKNNLVGTQGILFAPAEVAYLEDDAIAFSEVIEIYNGRGAFFQVRFPVYEKQKNGAYYKVGNVVLLHNTEKIGEILDLAASAYSKEDSYMAVLDKNENTISASGNIEIWNNYTRSEDKNVEFLAFEENLVDTGWSIRYVTMKKSYMNYMNRVQLINIITYIIIIAAFMWMCYMVYSRVIGFIKKQMTFVVGYTQDTSQRIKVSDTEEFGELEKEINEMLDGIEELNQKIIEGEKKYLKLEYAKKQTEMIAYKNQINPHFMYNTLECIRGMALYRGEREIAKLTAAMSKLFRYNVKGDEIVTVRKVINSLKEYATIIEYRFMGKIRIEIKAEELVLGCRIPKMLVQPLVENAVRHGVEPKVERGCVIVKMTILKNGKIGIEIRDDGCGMDMETLENQRKKLEKGIFMEDDIINTTGLGLRNVSRRMYLFYGDEAEMYIDSLEGTGTRIMMELPQQI